MKVYICSPVVGIPSDHADLEGAIRDALHRVQLDGVEGCRVYAKDEDAQPEPTYRRMLTIIGPDTTGDDE